MTNVATLAYVPYLDRLWPKRFLRNLDAYQRKYPLILYSDFKDGRYSDFIHIPSPDPLKKSKNKTACQNALFLYAIKIASEQGLDRFIYLEADCRVGCDNWDAMMFNGWRDGAVVAGTPNLFNTEAMPKEYWPMVQSYISDYTAATGLPVAQFLANEKTKRLGSCMFMMGAGAIYDTKAMLELFPNFQNCIGSYACRTAAFDLHIGLRLFQIYGAHALNHMPWLACSFSGFGNKVLDLGQRIERLRSGRACLIHQYKEKSDLLFKDERKCLALRQRSGRSGKPVSAGV